MAKAEKSSDIQKEIVDMEERYGYSPLHLAAIKGDKEAEARLLNSDIELAKSAVCNGRFKTLELLLKNNTNWNREDRGKLLWYAIDRAIPGSEEGGYYSDVNGKMKGYDSEVLAKGCSKSAYLLLKEDVDVNIMYAQDGDRIGKYGKTPLHLGVQSEDMGIVEELLKCGADMNRRGRYGDTPMHSAFDVDNTMVKLLLKYDLNNKLNIFIKNKENVTTFSLAKQLDNEEIMQKFEAKFKSTIVEAVAGLVNDAFHLSVQDDPATECDELVSAFSYLKDSKILTDFITTKYSVDQKEAKIMINSATKRYKKFFESEDMPSHLTSNLIEYLNNIIIKDEAQAIAGKVLNPAPSGVANSPPSSPSRKNSAERGGTSTSR